jgi:large subunit ribosomal protein L21e
MKGSHGYRRRTRSIKTKSRDKGKVRINRYLQEFKEGDVVSIAIDPTYQAIPHPRFRGKSGKIVGKQGRVYFVRITDGGKQKDVLVAPEHLVGV